MKLYTCTHCYSELYFEGRFCRNCNMPVGFDVEQMVMVTLTTIDNIFFNDINNRDKVYCFCENEKQHVCNWLIPQQHTTIFCKACDLNRTIPDLSSPQNHERWRKIEVAKHRLIYSLFRLYLPVIKKEGDAIEGIAFDFLADASPEKKIIMGHENGVITLNIEEADDIKRLKNKLNLGERYRTLLGHFRHEIGHYYWDVLVQNKPSIERYREVFGNEQKDYAKALRDYYRKGPPPNWYEHFISPYSTAHPWEDWAETWAHYMHLMDTLETAFYFGIGIHPVKKGDGVATADINLDPYTIDDFGVVFKMWVSFTFAANSLNRSMGYTDFYPFIISKGVEVKLQFIHEICQAARYSLRSSY